MNFRQKLSGVSALVLLPATQAFAAVPANVTTALNDGLADASTVAGLALIIVIAVVVFKKMGRAAS